MLLKKYAKDLKEAGLNRINISLDTLNPDKFKFITRIGELKDTLAGIDAALNVSMLNNEDKDRQQLVIDYQNELKQIYMSTYQELDETDKEKRRQEKDEYEFLQDISNGIFVL